jgi:hypothetical protein
MPPVGSPPAPATALFAAVFATAPGEDHHVSPDGLSDCIQLGLAHVRPEELDISSLHTHDGKTRPAGSLTNMTTLTYKDFSHVTHLLLQHVLGICSK